MRLLICAGGTGGGVYPALTVLQTLGAEAQPVLWVGGEGGMEAELVQRVNVPYTSIPAAGVHGVGLRVLPGNLLRLSRGTIAARRILREFQPDVILFTGGYVAVPMALAGRSYPILLYVPDIEPGLALKTLARFADRIAVSTSNSKQYFPNDKRVIVTGYPTRPEMRPMPKADARKFFGFQAELPVVLVSGGSKGARSINYALMAILPQLLPAAQVLHVTGKLDWEEVKTFKEGLPAELAGRYQVFPYLHDEMGTALAAADLAVSRAGASTLGEYPLFGLPAILVPYPYAWRYQKVNADYLVRNHAALLIEDAQMGEKLLPAILDLLHNPEQLSSMQRSMHSLAQPNAASHLADQVRELARKSQKGNRALW